MEFWGVTHKGCVRKENQDAYDTRQLDKNTILCVVCDGMGGARAGNIASTLAVDVFTQTVCGGWRSGMSWDKADMLLKAGVREANAAVYEESSQIEEFRGMGTTLVAVLIRGKEASVVNVGDSRAYLISENGIRQVSKDHSLVQFMVDCGELTPEQAKVYPGKNLITRAVGTDSKVDCDIFRLEGERGEYFLLCSDGLSNMVDDQEILFEVAHVAKKESCCQRLLDIVISRGAPDNVTGVLAGF